MFSVIMPVYNKGHHIANSIESVLNQSFKEFELIVVNDGSTDNSVNEIAKFRDQRIKLINLTKASSGGYVARNIGIGSSKFEWLALIDADDLWTPFHLEKMKGLIEKNPNIKVFSSGYLISESNKTALDAYSKKFTGKSEFCIITVKEYLDNCYHGCGPIWTSVVVFKKDDYVLSKLFPEYPDVKRSGDLFAWLKLVTHYRLILWSKHVGAKYMRDSENMVTKKACPSTALYSREFYNYFSMNLTHVEKKFLAKYFNRMIYKAISINLIKSQKLQHNFYWKEDIISALLFYLLLKIKLIKYYILKFA